MYHENVKDTNKSKERLEAEEKIAEYVKRQSGKTLNFETGEHVEEFFEDE